MRLAPLFDLHPLADSTFELPKCPESGGRLLGGALIASSVVAAARTVRARLRPVSLQTTFMRGGRVDLPVTFSVVEAHEGRSLPARGVVASQGDRVLAASTIRFHADATDATVWQAESRRELCPPEQGRPEDAALVGLGFLADFEIRAALSAVERPVMHPFWVRPTAALLTAANPHEALLAFLTDMGVSASASPPGTRLRDRRRSLSLDHSLWWHRPIRMDQWLCFDAQPLINHGGRGLARGTVHDLEGRLIASFAQEVLLAAVP